MCEFKTEEHKMTPADVRRIAKEIVWNNSPAAIAAEPEAIVSVVLANDPFVEYATTPGMYWQPDMQRAWADRHLVTDEQYRRIVAETDKQAQRVSKLLSHPATTTVR